jgi:hypothetical protein
MKYNLLNLCHIGDMVAIPFFIVSTYYFYNIENKNNIENVLFFFSISGLVFDILYTFIFILNYRAYKKL